MAKKRKNSRRKGSRGELELAHELTRVLGIEFCRGQQFNGLDGEDVRPTSAGALPGIHFECKRCESLSLYAAMKQAERDAKERIPVLCHRRNDRPWLVVLRLDDLPELAASIAALQTGAYLDTEVTGISAKQFCADPLSRLA